MSADPPPYELIAKSLRDGLVIPFLGSGASLGSRSDADTWSAGDADFLPTASELAEYLAHLTGFPGEERQLTTVAQYYSSVAGGRGALERELHQIFDCNYAPGALHTFLATIPARLLVVTTNYDDLVEQAFTSQGRPFDVVVHSTDRRLGEKILWWPHGATSPTAVTPNKLDIKLDETDVVYKMHGAVNRGDSDNDQYVITEDDYVEFVARMTNKRAVPSIFAIPFQKRHFLFLGYGLRDWNFRVVLNRIERDMPRGKDFRSWAIDANPSALESRFWQERRVEVYRLAIESFVEELKKH